VTIQWKCIQKHKLQLFGFIVPASGKLSFYWRHSSVVRCWSLAGGSSLPCVRSMVDRWSLCG